MAVKPITSRKLDLFYLIFFATHIPIALFIDTIPLWPKWGVPGFSRTVRAYYIETYRDNFFIAPSAWFKLYILLEAIYHLPLSFWMLKALPNDHPLMPLNLLVFGVEVTMTTLTCLVEMLSWEGYTNEELTRLLGLYVPYLVIAVLMSTDAFLRLKKICTTKDKRG